MSVQSAIIIAKYATLKTKILCYLHVKFLLQFIEIKSLLTSKVAFLQEKEQKGFLT